MLQNLTRHAADIIFLFRDYKKLPQDTAEFPFQGHATTYALAEGSATVLQKMRQGGIFLTAHYGNYEAIGPWLCRLGIPLKASYIPLKPAWLNHIVENRMRAVDGKSYAVSAKTPREFLRLLDEHKLFCLLSDQDSRIPSAQSGTFFGIPAHMNPLPDFLLKHRPKTPLHICWIEEPDLRTKRFHAEKLRVGEGETVIEGFNRWLESRIAKEPALWYSFTHRRFYSTTPEIYN
jgi:KDO2-lipid IV(A) lauroyltransferase